MVSFIRDLYHQPEGIIPLHAPVFRGNEKKYLAECIDTTYVSYVGEFVTRFEEAIAAYTGAKYAVAVVNGTAALQIALIVAGVEENDEVITQPLTFVATANAIRHANAWPVFIDVDHDTLGMSPSALQEFLEENVSIENECAVNKSTGRRIKAVVPMHTFGFPCRIDQIIALCRKYNLVVIEDAAESLGSFYKGKHTGTFGLSGILSFNGNKIITTGGGGMIITDDKTFAEKAKHLTTTAKVPHAWEYIHDQIGYNYRMPNINAAVGLAQYEQLVSHLNIKRKVAQTYKVFFENEFSEITYIEELADSHSNFWLNTILFPDKISRNQCLKYCHEQGIMIRPAWRLMHRLKMFKQCQTFNLNESKKCTAKLINLPSSVIV
ncbi:MAG: LegC family aminotransferase [Chloroflexi bacterium]|nr:LegC family aminotransferase [Chloroflexota bacterium]